MRRPSAAISPTRSPGTGCSGNDWLDDDTIALLATVSAISAIAFFVRVLTAREPIVDLKSFGDRNFALGSLFSFVLGIGLYGLTYLYPVYLGQIRGYER